MSKEMFGDLGGLIRMLTGRPSYPRSVIMRLNRTLMDPPPLGPSQGREGDNVDLGTRS